MRDEAELFAGKALAQDGGHSAPVRRVAGGHRQCRTQQVPQPPGAPHGIAVLCDRVHGEHHGLGLDLGAWRRRPALARHSPRRAHQLLKQRRGGRDSRQLEWVGVGCIQLHQPAHHTLHVRQLMRLVQQGGVVRARDQARGWAYICALGCARGWAGAWAGACAYVHVHVHVRVRVRVQRHVDELDLLSHARPCAEDAMAGAKRQGE